MLTGLVSKVERVFVIGTPLSRVSNEEWRAAYKVLSLDPTHLLKHSQRTLVFQSVMRWSVCRLPGDRNSVMTCA